MLRIELVYEKRNPDSLKKNIININKYKLYNEYKLV